MNGGAPALPGAAYQATYESVAGEDIDLDGGWLFGFVDILTLVVTLLALLLAFTYLSHKRYPPESGAGRSSGDAATAHRPAPAPGPPAVAGRPAFDPGPLLTRPRRPDLQVRPAVPAEPPMTPAGPEFAMGGAPTAQRQTAPAAQVHRRLIVPPAISKQVKVTATAHRINLLIKDDVLFDVASARLTTAGAGLLDHVARLLNTTDYPVSVEGHADDTPIHTARFPSNWELSAARATNVTRYLIGRGVAATRLRATGYGATRPLASNATAAGRAQNRRVALVLHMDKAAAAVTTAGHR